MIDFLAITTGQWVMIWFVGLVVAYAATAWKVEMDGLLGVLIYFLVSLLLFFAVVIYDIFITLWAYLG